MTVFHYSLLCVTLGHTSKKKKTLKGFGPKKYIYTLFYSPTMSFLFAIAVQTLINQILFWHQ